MSSFERIAIEILKKQGFKDFKKPVNKSFDYEARKDDVIYAIEIKGTGQSGIMGRLIVPWHELRDLYLHFLTKDHEQKALLIFVNDIGDFAIFEMIEARIIS